MPKAESPESAIPFWKKQWRQMDKEVPTESGNLERKATYRALDVLSETHNKRLSQEMKPTAPTLKTGLTHQTEVASLRRYEIPKEGFDEAELEQIRRVEPPIVKIGRKRKNAADGALHIQGLVYVPKENVVDSLGTEDGVIAELNEVRRRALAEAEKTNESFAETVQPGENDRYAQMAKKNNVPDEEGTEIDYSNYYSPPSHFSFDNSQKGHVYITKAGGEDYGHTKEGLVKAIKMEHGQKKPRGRREGVKVSRSDRRESLEQTRKRRKQLDDSESSFSQEIKRGKQEKQEAKTRLVKNRENASDILRADNRKQNPNPKDWRSIQNERLKASISFEEKFIIKLEEGEFSSLHVSEIFRQFRNEEEKHTIEIRLHRLQEKQFLQIHNREGKMVEEIIYECLDALMEFFSVYEKDIKDLQLAEGFVSSNQYLQKYFQRMLLDYPKIYASGDNYAVSSRMDLLGKLKDSMCKAFGWSLRLPVENLLESDNKKKRKREMSPILNAFIYKMYKLIDQLPVLESPQQKVA